MNRCVLKGLNLSTQRTDHSTAEGLVETKGVADGVNTLSDPQISAASHRNQIETLGKFLNPENRQVLRPGKSDDRRGCRRTVTESDGDSGRGAGNDMIVGDHMAIEIPDKPGPGTRRSLITHVIEEGPHRLLAAHVDHRGGSFFEQLDQAGLFSGQGSSGSDGTIFSRRFSSPDKKGRCRQNCQNQPQGQNSETDTGSDRHDAFLSKIPVTDQQNLDRHNKSGCHGVMKPENHASPSTPDDKNATGEPAGGEPISPVRADPQHPASGELSNENHPARAAGLFIAIAGILLWADLWTKSAAFRFLDVRIFTTPDGMPAVTQSDIYEIFPGFALEAALNLGAFNGWFAWAPGMLIGVSLLALPVCFYIATFRSDGRLMVTALGLIASGAAGNLYDRALIGGVRDFIRWSIQWGEKEYVWPNFNIADSAIVCGVALILWMEWRRPAELPANPPEAESAAAN